MDMNVIIEERGDVYSTSTGTYLDHDVWLINLRAYFHMNFQREWFCEYEKNNGGDALLGYDSLEKSIGCVNFK